MPNFDEVSKKDVVTNELELKTENGQVVVSSRVVAVRFEKEHSKVTRDIESLIGGIAKNGDTQNSLFIETQYQNEQNKQFYKEYLLTKDGFTLLAMGFTGTKALEWKLKYIEAFNKMENALKKLTPTRQLSHRQELVLDIYDGGSKAIVAHKELVKIEVTEETAKLKDGTNKILSAKQVVEMLGIRKLTTMLLHEWFEENGFGELVRFPYERNRLFQPSKKFVDYVAVKGYSFTGTTVKGNKIKVTYSTAMVDRLMDKHMASIVQFVKLRTE